MSSTASSTLRSEYSRLYHLECSTLFSFFFFNDTATTEIYTLSLHDALPIFRSANFLRFKFDEGQYALVGRERMLERDVLRSEEHTSELQSQSNLVCRLLLEKKKKKSRMKAGSLK